MELEMKDALELVVIPLIAALIWFILRLNSDTKSAMSEVKGAIEGEMAEMKAELHSHRERTHKRIDEAYEAVSDIRQSVGAWQLEVVRTFFTKSEAEKLEQRFIAQMERVDVKLVKMEEKMDEMVRLLTKMVTQK